MKKIVCIFTIMIIILIPTMFSKVNAVENDATLDSQKKEFGIQDFIENSKQYNGEFFENIDVGNILNNAIKGKVDNETLFKRILSQLGTETLVTIFNTISYSGF